MLQDEYVAEPGQQVHQHPVQLVAHGAGTTGVLPILQVLERGLGHTFDPFALRTGAQGQQHVRPLGVVAFGQQRLGVRLRSGHDVSGRGHTTGQVRQVAHHDQHVVAPVAH